MIAQMMGSLLHKSLFSFLFHLFLLHSSSSFPLCTNSRAPIRLNTPLAFCSYNGSSCCNATEDAELQKQFSSMNISDSACGSIVKLILCTKCDPYSSDLFTVETNLFTVETKARKVPILCSNEKSNEASMDFCCKVWNTCKNEKIQNSLFSAAASASEPISSSKLTDHWKSSTEFCKALGGSADTESICFNGTSVSFKNTVDLNPPQGICVEKIGNGSYLSMEPHPDGSNRVFLSDQAGLIWLASVPTQDSGGTLDLNESNIFLDLTDTVHADTEFGVMGLAFHPNFTKNGRFFVSFNCDKVQVASCSGRCSCNSEVGCDPSKLDLVDGDQLCRYQSVVSEFTANSSSSTPSEATSAIPSEVRRIFTMGLPYTGHHAGQILFGPEDGYLYFMMGDGGNKGDPFNFAQNKKSVLGKIMRLDVNKIPSSSEINDLGLWGNYSIPKDNPSSTDDSELLPEIWALGLRNPWRCSFDSKRPSYFFCGDVGEDTYEEINLISKGGNYGWRLYEGPHLFHPSWTPGGNTSLNSINQIFPVMGYNHSSVNNKEGSASITGGYVYRSNTDPCLNGRFVYADLYGEAMWAGIENPKLSGIYNSTKLPFSCAKDTPIACETIEGSSLPSMGIVYSFAEDNDGEIYILASKGVFRLVRPSRCNYSCASESHTDTASPPRGTSSSTAKFTSIHLKLMLFLSSFIILFNAL
ncbi:HIPL1 protein [Dendrobium catenatum]|uniref:HIPL1 protein n=1 Tax=Dendrobium catenatum TaxID=906689 RepID=A0A2I0X3J6_9ASPA|nr:HIPL1 protein [Dendrobium catenatum]